jgi:hypothetical protein
VFNSKVLMLSCCYIGNGRLMEYMYVLILSAQVGIVAQVGYHYFLAKRSHPRMALLSIL